MALGPDSNAIKGGKTLSMMRPDGEELAGLAMGGQGARGKPGGKNAKGRAKGKGKARYKATKQHQPATTTNTTALAPTSNKAEAINEALEHHPVTTDVDSAPSSTASTIHTTTSINNIDLFTLDRNRNQNNLNPFLKPSPYAATQSFEAHEPPSSISSPFYDCSPTITNRYGVIDPSINGSVSISASPSSSGIGHLDGPTMQGLRDHRSGWGAGPAVDWDGASSTRRGELADPMDMEMQYAPGLPTRYVPPSPPTSVNGEGDVNNNGAGQGRIPQRAYHSTPPLSEPGSEISEGAETTLIRRRVELATGMVWSPTEAPCPPHCAMTLLSPCSLGDGEAREQGLKRRMSSGVSAHLTECSDYDMMTEAGTSKSKTSKKSKKSKKSQRMSSPSHPESYYPIHTILEVSPRIIEAMVSLRYFQRLQLKYMLEDLACTLGPLVGEQLNEETYKTALFTIRTQTAQLLNFLASILCAPAASGKYSLAMESLTKALAEIVLLVTKLWGGEHEQPMDLDDPAESARNKVAYEETPLCLADLRTALANLIICMNDAEGRTHRSGRQTGQVEV